MHYIYILYSHVPSNISLSEVRIHLPFVIQLLPCVVIFTIFILQLFHNVNFYKAWKFHIIYVCGVAGCCENVWECATSVTQSLAGGGGCRDMWGLA